MAQDFNVNDYWYSYLGGEATYWDHMPPYITMPVTGKVNFNKESWTRATLEEYGWSFVDVYPNYNDVTHTCRWATDKWVIEEIPALEEELLPESEEEQGGE